MRITYAASCVLVTLMAGAGQAQFTARTSTQMWTPKQRSQNNATSNYGYSDCTTENALGLTNGGQPAWFQGFDTNARGFASDIITTVSTANGSIGGGGVPAGSMGGGFVYDDPGGDFTNPTDLTGADLVGSASWITCCPDSDTKEPIDVGAAPVSDGFWLAGMMTHLAGEFPIPLDSDTVPSMSRSWVTGSNTTFDPMNPGAGVGFVEMASLGFDAHFLITGDGTGGGVTTYCTAKSGLVCGLPAIAFSGVPAAGATSGFEIRAAPARGNRTGLVLYSCSGRANFPFQGGILCVNPAPLRRTTIIASGGTNGACDGVFRIDFNTFATGGLGGNPDACLATSGQQVNAQVWGRDSVATGSFLSDALEFSM